MPDIGHLAALQPDIAIRRRRGAGRMVRIGATTACVAIAALTTQGADAARAAQAAGNALTTLLRAMAGLKMMFEAVLIAAIYWRLARAARRICGASLPPLFDRLAFLRG